VGRKTNFCIVGGRKLDFSLKKKRKIYKKRKKLVLAIKGKGKRSEKEK
jgi:hypothetical protein